MAPTDTPLTPATRALEAVRLGDLSSLSESSLLDLVGQSARNERLARAQSAVLAGEVARRSAPELGHHGISQRLGHRTPAKLIQSITGATARDVGQVVRIGVLEQSRPWLGVLATTIADGTVSTDAADAIRAGLGEPREGVTAGSLAAAAVRLAAQATSLDADQLFTRARHMRDDLDADGIIDRERADRDARSFRLHRLRDGNVRAVWQLDPVDGSVLAEIYDRATSPKLGGPRFGTDEERMHRIADDPRSPEQLASDVIFGLITAGADVRPAELLGRGAPAVRVTITERELRARTGHGRLQGGQLAVSIETVERIACAQGVVPVVFDQHGQPLDVGRERRLFTPRQRTALSERDGGCMWTRCERPPSWTEAHHINHWKRDGGRTDVADGILLCKHHHLLLHDHHWEVERRGESGSEYWLIPPPGHADPAPRRLASKSLALRELLAG